MTRQLHDSITGHRIAFVLAGLLATLVLVFHPLPLVALLHHVRHLLAALIPFAIGLPFGLALIGPKTRNESTLDLKRLLYAIGLGQGLLYLLTFLLLTTGLVYMILFPLLAMGLILIFLRRWKVLLQEIRLSWQSANVDLAPLRSVLLFLSCAGVLYLGCALLPPTNYDALEYHLAVPEAWLKNHGWVHFPHNIYAWFPMNVELLYLWGLALGGTPAATIINLFFAVVSAAGVWVLGRRGGSEHAGWLAVVLFLASGLVMRLVIQADIDLGVCFYALLALLAFVQWRERSEPLKLVLSAVFVGLALGCKYIAAISVWVPMVILVLLASPPGKVLKGLAWMLFLPACVVAPWLVRNEVMVGNPVFPLLYRWFGGEGWSAAADAFFRTAHAPKPLGVVGHLRELIRSPFDLTITDLSVFSPLIVAGGLLAIFFGRRDRLVRLLLSYAAVVFFLWFVLTQRNHRFLVTIAPPVAVVAAWGLAHGGSWLRQPVRWPVWVICCASLYFLLSGLSVKSGLNFLTGLEDVSEYYERLLPHMRAIRFLNDKHRDQPVRVLFVGEAQAYGCQFDAIVPVVFNPHPWLPHDPSGNAVPQSAEQAAQRLRELGVTHVLYNESELTRLIRGYAPQGWPDGRELARLIHLMDGTWLQPVFETENGVIRVFEVADTGG